MAKPFIVRTITDHDLDDYSNRIAQDNPSAALRFLDAVQATYEQICNFPSIGSLRYRHLSIVETIRVYPVIDFNNYQIFYIDRRNHIDILRIIHSSMNISEEMLNSV